MTGRRAIARAVGDGPATGVDQAWSSHRATTVAEGDEAGFDDAHRTADAVPGWFDRVTAACSWSVVHELRPRRDGEIGSYLDRSTVLPADTCRHAGLLLAPREFVSVDDVVTQSGVDPASREGIAAAGPTRHGTVAGSIWGGRLPHPPSCPRTVRRRERRPRRVTSVSPDR